MDGFAQAVGEVVIGTVVFLPIGVAIHKLTEAVIDEAYNWKRNHDPIIIEGEKTKDTQFSRCRCDLHCCVCSRAFPSEKGEKQTQRTYCYECGQIRRIERL
jgi:hypothetical protein